VKMESMNPGGTGKDRAAMSMLQEAQRSNPIYGRNCNIVEGTSGSTGIALATLCLARGLQLHVVMPDDQADEKRRLLECLGVRVHIVPNCAISNPNHYVNAARKLATDIGGIFMNQFENVANYQAHFDTTGPEIWSQTGGSLDAFVMSAGTGGTIAGVSQYLKSRISGRNYSGRAGIEVVLADPQGSSLFNRVTQGVCYTSEQAETRLKKHRYDSLVEGVGLDRVTANFQNASIDSAESVTDQEVLLTAHWLLANEGLFVGSSSALNVAAALRVAKRLGPGSTVVTIICDTGQRHVSRFWNREYIGKYSLQWPEDGKCAVPACVRAFAES
jgi:cysteine synthase A